MDSDDHLRALVAHLRESKSVLFITGAGVSADSGLPTYRGIGGLYNEEDTEDGIPIEEALSGRVLLRNMELTWKHIGRIEAACRGAGFNRAHEVMALFEERFERVCVLTQNVDGFHQAAGSKNVIPIHGDFHDLLCMECAHRTRVANYADLELPPRCPECGDYYRPEVVLFGEMLPLREVQRLQDELARGFDVIFSVGTTSVFPYIAQPILQSRYRDTLTVEINPGQTEVSRYVDIKVAGGAAKTLDGLWSELVAAG